MIDRASVLSARRSSRSASSAIARSSSPDEQDALYIAIALGDRRHIVGRRTSLRSLWLGVFGNLWGHAPTVTVPGIQAFSPAGKSASTQIVRTAHALDARKREDLPAAAAVVGVMSRAVLGRVEAADDSTARSSLAFSGEQNSGDVIAACQATRAVVHHEVVRAAADRQPAARAVPMRHRSAALQRAWTVLPWMRVMR